jgi:hypothetical protein
MDHLMEWELTGETEVLGENLLQRLFFSFGATAHIWALAYLRETFRFTSVY